MANSALNANPFAQLQSFTQLSIVRQIMLMLLLAGGVALGVSVVLWSRGNNFTVLYSNLSTQDISEITAALESAKLDYRIEPGTGYLAVPESSLQETRLHLASLGLPRASVAGYDILSEEFSLGTSNFIEQARYNRALEQELVKTIKLLRGVRDVRVHISIPKQSSFLRSSSKPSASVMLDVVGTGSISDMQIAGVGHLVASSVAGLKSEDVSIVDQKGNLLSGNGDDPLGSSNEQLKYTRSLEQEYTQRIIDILTPIVGPDNIRAQVTADLDFTMIETTEEAFDPASRVVRSEQTLEENRGGGRPQPGSLSPAPPETGAAEETAEANAQAGNGQSRLNTTRNYEIDKSTSYIRRTPGTIRRLSVAVLVDLNAAETSDPQAAEARIERLSQLVKDTIGFDPDRGDSVNVVDERFSQPVIPEEPQMIEEIWQSPMFESTLKQLAASALILLLVFAVFRPALKSVLSPITTREISPAPGLTHDGGEGGEEVALAIKKMPSRSVYDENLSLAQTLVANEPARAARMIKEWVGSD